MTKKRRSSARAPWGPPITFTDPVNGPARAVRALVQEQLRLNALKELALAADAHEPHSQHGEQPLTPQQETFRAWAERNVALARQRDAEGLPELASDAREEAREAHRLTRARQAGYTCAICSRCGNNRVLSWAGGLCTEWADNEEQVCGGTYHASNGS